MALQSVLVTDTNIWIDLENGGVIVEVFRLPYRFLIPDFAKPELIKPNWKALETLGLEAHELNTDQVIELVQLRQVHKNLSIVDLSAILLAKMLSVTLLTGDRHVNEVATVYGLRVHGVLWLLDEMIHFRTLIPRQAASALQWMLDKGARLPTEECKNRLSIWSV